MITLIRIRNFQGHRKLDIPIEENITTIIGPSDAGKSAVLRALRWVMLNEPKGSSFLTTGEEFCRVSIVVDGTKVIRKRSKKENYYLVDGSKCVAFKEEKIPAAVAKLFNVSPVNVQKQHEESFWLSLSAGQLAKSLNAIVNLGEIDEVLARSQAGLRKNKANIEYMRDKALKHAARVEEIKATGLADKLRALNTLDKAVERARKLRKKASTLAAVLRKARAKQLELKELSGRATIDGGRLNKLLQRQARIEKAAEQHRSLGKLIEQIKEKKERSWELKRLLGETTTALNQFSKKSCPLCGKERTS